MIIPHLVEESDLDSQSQSLMSFQVGRTGISGDAKTRTQICGFGIRCAADCTISPGNAGAGLSTGSARYFVAVGVAIG